MVAARAGNRALPAARAPGCVARLSLAVPHDCRTGAVVGSCIVDGGWQRRRGWRRKQRCRQLRRGRRGALPAVRLLQQRRSERQRRGDEVHVPHQIVGRRVKHRVHLPPGPAHWRAGDGRPANPGVRMRASFVVGARLQQCEQPRRRRVCHRGVKPWPAVGPASRRGFRCTADAAVPNLDVTVASCVGGTQRGERGALPRAAAGGGGGKLLPHGARRVRVHRMRQQCGCGLVTVCAGAALWCVGCVPAPRTKQR